MAGGVLPVARYRGRIYFLFGREAHDGKWSDFGGGKEGKETDWQTAMREGSEELNGFFGSPNEMAELVKNHGVIELHNDGYTTFVFEIDYDDNLPDYFGKNHRFIKKHLPREVTKNNGLFEKSAVAWFSLSEMRRSRQFFRHFYRKILDQLIANSEEIQGNMRPSGS